MSDRDNERKLATQFRRLREGDAAMTPAFQTVLRRAEERRWISRGFLRPRVVFASGLALASVASAGVWLWAELSSHAPSTPSVSLLATRDPEPLRGLLSSPGERFWIAKTGLDDAPIPPRRLLAGFE